ncbi:MAG: CesT family type III secretion system chaperone [Polyangiaceae bacterium]
MRTAADVEAYLLKMNRRFRAVDDQPGTFVVDVDGWGPGPNLPAGRATGGSAGAPTGGPTQIAVRVDPPLVVVRVHIGNAAPTSDPASMSAFYRRLLELNARELVHASYGVDQGHVVLSSALELENLDYNELEATMDEIDLALSQHLPDLAKLAGLTQSKN